MKNYLVILGLFLTINLFGQSLKREEPQKFAVLKGMVKNNTERTWNLLVIGYFKSFTRPIPIDAQGRFEEKINLTDEYQDIRLDIDEDSHYQFLCPGDTIEVNWDALRIKQTFEIKSSNSKRNKDIQVLFQLYNKFDDDYNKLTELMSDQTSSDSVKFSRINNLYNKEMNYFLSYGDLVSGEKIACDIYFRYADFLLYDASLPKYSLKLTSPTSKISILQIEPYLQRVLSEWHFKRSFRYRDFIYDHTRFCTPFNGSLKIEKYKGEEEEMPFSPTRDYYYLALANIRNYEIRDWFISMCIMNGFEHFSFKETEAIYKDFLTQAKTKRYIDTLSTYYAIASKLKPGKTAPDFKLKNDKGKIVSLSDFKGKNVYIDFWGVGCGPCIQEITNNVPALHEKYKDKNIVFLNICVDANVSTWRSKIKALNLEGVNLLAEGWGENPVCKAYEIKGIPHYILIDKEGKIVESNAPRPSEKERLEKALNEVLTNK